MSIQLKIPVHNVHKINTVYLEVVANPAIVLYNNFVIFQAANHAIVLVLAAMDQHNTIVLSVLMINVMILRLNLVQNVNIVHAITVL